MPPARSYIFIGLNATRALSIISLILLFASSIVTLVQDIKAVNAFIAAGKTDYVASGNSTIDCSQLEYIPNSTVPNQPAGAFWAVLNRLLIMFQAVVLIMSEVGWPAAFFNRFFPILGDEFGLGALGVIQCLLGAAVLSHFVDEFSLVSAFLVFSLGCLNIFLGLIFREKAKPYRSLTSWNATDDVLPRTSLHSGPRPFLTGTNTGSTWNEKGTFAARNASLMSQKKGMGFGRKGEEAALQRGHTLTRPQEALPPYASPRPAAPVPLLYRKVSGPQSEPEARGEPTHAAPRPTSELTYMDPSDTQPAEDAEDEAHAV